MLNNSLKYFRRPSVPTSSLPLVGTLPYGHHTHSNSQQIQTARHQYPSPYPSLPPQPQPNSHHSYNTANTTVASAAGLVTANNNGNSNNVIGNTQIPPLSSSIMGARSRPKYSELPQHVVVETAAVSGTRKSSSEASPASPIASGSYRPLNVIDALAYLDLVKGRFADNPNVYNKFLDIMKDFKSQSIDTPGVIERVSTLFKGHPQLISGFNTFLPAGYRIECSIDPRDPNRIIVTIPNGNKTTSTTSTTEEMLKMEPQSQQHLLHHDHYYSSSSTPSTYLPPLPPPPQHQQNVTTQSMHNNNNNSALPPPFNTNNRHFNSTSGSAAPSIHHHPHHQQQQQHIANTTPPPQSINLPQQQYNPLPLPPPPPLSRHVSSTSPSPAVDKKPPVEFNHAINYVNRIKVIIQFNLYIYFILK